MKDRIQTWMDRTRVFFEDVRAELVKCSWPTRQELWQSTLVIIVSVVFLAAYVAVCDGVVILALEALLPK
jgi:preprotein translocase subunit SecE